MLKKTLRYPPRCASFITFNTFALLASQSWSANHTIPDMTKIAKMNSSYDIEKRKYLPYFNLGEHGCSERHHEIATTPLFSLKAKHAVEADNVAGDEDKRADEKEKSQSAILPQYGLLGFTVADQINIDAHEPIMLNTNAPNSTFICGSQGSGKSYTLATILESLIRPNEIPGKPGNPVAGVVFHYDVNSSGSIADAAHLASLGIKVDVLVPKSSARKLRNAYERELKDSPNLSVRPLKLRSKDLSVERMNKLMAFAESEGKVPLYMDVILQILRQMAYDNEKTEDDSPFSYTTFRRLLANASARFTPQQSNPMKFRLNLLESYMVDDPTRNNDGSKLFDLQPGSLTIVDLSDQFVDAATVCVLFDICLSLVEENAPSAGLVIALDEAHKYLNATVAAGNFTERLTTTIREQRHNSTRVIIATQEPTLSAKLLDLCSVSIIHRFSSPAWFETIKAHIGGASSLLTTAEQQKQLMENIVCLNTGESFVFSPSSYLCVEDEKARKLASGSVRMKTRLRIGADRGQSKMAKDVDGAAGIANGMAVVSL